jgi:hypothetical protein
MTAASKKAPPARNTWLGPNYTGNQDAAEKLSASIADYWRQRGQEVDVRVNSTPGARKDHAPILSIRSDMKQGFPIGARARTVEVV